MSYVSPDTRQREKDKMYLTDAELIRRLGVPEKEFRRLLPSLENKYGFPKKSPFFGARRFWPTVEKWLEKHERVNIGEAKGRPRHD